MADGFVLRECKPQNGLLTKKWISTSKIEPFNRGIHVYFFDVIPKRQTKLFCQPIVS